MRELRREIAESVRNFARNLAALASSVLPDPRGNWWIESLIRYRLRDDLPDIEREGIPGAVGRSELGEQDAAAFYMLSGLFEGRESYYPLDPDFDVVVFADDIDAGWQSSVELHDSLRYWPTGFYSVTGESLCFGGDVGDDCRRWLPCGNANQDSWEPPVFQYAEMYTGEMAYVTQMLFGMNGTVPYRYCYERTHGIYTAPNGKWVIEISAFDGITAWPLATLPFKQPGAAIDYTPIATGETLPLLQDRVLLLPGSAMDEYLNDSPHFIDCGWAFNSDGSKAINTSVGASDDPGIDALKGKLWRVTISGDSVGPTSASISLDEEDWLFNNSDSLNNMKFLKREFGGCFRSYQFSLPNNPPSGSLRAPVFAFYDGDTEVVIRHAYDPQSIEAVDGRPADAIYGCYNPTLYGINANGDSYRKGTDIVQSAAWFEVTGYDRGLEKPSNKWQSRAVECSGNWQQLGNWVTHIHDAQSGVASQHWRLTETNVDYDYNPPGYAEQLIVFAHSRTAFGIFQAKGPTLESRKLTYNSITGYAAGNFIPYYTCTKVLINEWEHAQGYINPCGCGEPGDVVAMVVERDAPQESIDEYELAVGVPLEPPKPEPNGTYDSLCLFDVLCFESGRLGTRPYTGACRWIDPGCIGQCNSPERQTVTVETLEPADPNGHCTFMYYDRGVRTQIFSEPYSLDFSPWWLIQEDGSACQWMDVMRDAHSGKGSISADIVSPFFVRHVFGNADSIYPQMGDLKKRMKGWFGVPFKE